MHRVCKIEEGVDTTGTEEVGEVDRDSEEGAEEEQANLIEKQEDPPIRKSSMQKELTV